MAINIDKSFEYNEKDAIKIDLFLLQDEIEQILQICKNNKNIFDFVPKYYKHFKIPHNMKDYINAVKHS